MRYSLTPHHRPPPWKQYVSGRHALLAPILTADWSCKWLAHVLGSWSFIEVLELLQAFSIVVVVGFYFAQSQDRVDERHNQAWAVINTAQGKGGSGGRITALQQLNDDHVPLVGVDISNAFLQDIQLTQANLRRADFSGADIRGANFRGSSLADADLSSANLRDANLSKADLDGANFENADLHGADLAGVTNWKSIRSLKSADVSDIRNSPQGFVDFAISMGATNKVGEK